MKQILALLLMIFPLFAYKQGDVVDPQMVRKLNIADDKLYIIDFFASWCSSCRKEIPRISAVNTQIDPAKVEIIGIDVDQKPSEAEAFQHALVESQKLNYRVVNDSDNSIIKTFDPVGMPSLFYVKDSKIVGMIIGAAADVDTRIVSDIHKLAR